MDATQSAQNQNTINKTPSLLKQILNFFAKILSAIKDSLKKIHYNLYVNKNGLLHFDLNNQTKSFCKIMGVFMAILFLSSMIELSFYMEKFAKTHESIIFFEKMVPLIIFALLTIIATSVFFKAAKENKIIIISDKRNIVINENGNNTGTQNEPRSEDAQVTPSPAVNPQRSEVQVGSDNQTNPEVQQNEFALIGTANTQITAPDQSVHLSDDGSDIEIIIEEDLKQSVQ